MEKQPTVFVDGVFITEKTSKDPEWILGSADINVKIFLEWLKKNYNQKEKVTIQLCRARSGKVYLKLNTFTPTQKPAPEVKPKDTSDQDFYNSF